MLYYYCLSVCTRTIIYIFFTIKRYNNDEKKKNINKKDGYHRRLKSKKSKIPNKTEEKEFNGALAFFGFFFIFPERELGRAVGDYCLLLYFFCRLWPVRPK